MKNLLDIIAKHYLKLLSSKSTQKVMKRYAKGLRVKKLNYVIYKPTNEPMSVNYIFRSKINSQNRYVYTCVRTMDFKKLRISSKEFAENMNTQSIKGMLPLQARNQTENRYVQLEFGTDTTTTGVGKKFSTGQKS